MDIAFTTIYRVITRSETALLASLIASAAITYLLMGDLRTLNRSRLLVSVALLCASMLVLIGTYIVFRQNRAWRQSASYVHDINHLYRDTLSALFYNPQKAPLSQNALLQVEQEILDRVCSKISAIFHLLTGKPCDATVYLIRDQNDSTACFVWASNDQHVEREHFVNIEFPLKQGQNTRFDAVLNLIEDRQRAMFYSGDICREDYKDSLPEFARFYRAVISVPIRCVVSTENGERESCILGFLTIDTKSVDRLNNHFHLEYAAAFADQIFSFIGIMRGYFDFSPIQANPKPE